MHIASDCEALEAQLILVNICESFAARLGDDGLCFVALKA